MSVKCLTIYWKYRLASYTSVNTTLLTAINILSNVINLLHKISIDENTQNMVKPRVDWVGEGAYLCHLKLFYSILKVTFFCQFLYNLFTASWVRNRGKLSIREQREKFTRQMSPKA